MFDVSFQTQNRLFAPSGSHIYLIQSCPSIRCCLFLKLFPSGEKKSLDSSVCWPVRYLYMFPLLLSLLLSIHLSLCQLTSGGDVRIKWPVNSCIPPSNYPVIRWDVLIEEIFSKGVWLIRRQRLIFSSCVSACPSSSSPSVQLSIDVLRTHRSRWSSLGGLCRSLLWSPVCLSPSPELPNTPESPLRRPAVAQLIVGRQGEKKYDTTCWNTVTCTLVMST